jgi:flagellar hook-basal body complex protein FliE
MSPLGPVQPFTPDLRPLPLPKAGATPATVPLQELQDVVPTFTPKPLEGPAQTPGSFGDMLGRLVSDVSAKQTAAGDTVRALLGGQNVPLHQAMIAMEEASLSFQLMVEVRNKLLESYQELMRMQV